MNGKRELYQKIFRVLMVMLKKYFSGQSRPFDAKKEHIYFCEFHKDMGKLLNLGDYSIVSAVYEALCNAIPYRMTPCIEEPKKFLIELWNALLKFTDHPLNAGEQQALQEYITDFCRKWHDSDLAANLMIAFASEAIPEAA